MRQKKGRRREHQHRRNIGREYRIYMCLVEDTLLRAQDEEPI